MKKVTIPVPRPRGKKPKPAAIGKRGRHKVKLDALPAPKQWPDFKSRLTKLRVTSRSVRDIVDDLRHERA